jgi:hypothetical protein
MRTKLWAVAAVVVFGLAAVVMRVPDERPLPETAPRMVRIGEMSVPRATHQATLLETGRVLITGGCTGMCESVHASTETYDPDARAFRPAAPMSEPRAGHIAVALPDGRVLVAGGWTGRGATASAETFDPVTGKWSVVDQMTEPRMNPAAARLPDGRVLVAGGTLRARHPLASAEVFDPSTGVFSAVGPMEEPRGMLVATPLEDGRVLVTGGHGPGGKLRSTEIFDPRAGAFEPAGNMSLPRDRHAAVRLADGRVLMIGGQRPGEPGGRYASTEVYDPATGEFLAGPSMRWERQKIIDAVALLPSGTVVVAGGARQPEIWRPGEPEFTPVGGEEMAGRHEFATATLLGSGDVLVLGGYGVRPAERSASAWLVRVAE